MTPEYPRKMITKIPPPDLVPLFVISNVVLFEFENGRPRVNILIVHL
jgi:hypothetical protein